MNDKITYHRETILPNWKSACFSVTAKKLNDAWFLHMHADYVPSKDCTTEDLFGGIGTLEAEWLTHLKERFG